MSSSPLNKVIVYSTRPVWHFIRPLNKRLRHQRYLIVFILCLLLTIVLNSSYKKYYYYKYDADVLAIVPYYLIEKNYAENTELNFKSEIENGIWRYKEKIKNDRDLVNADLKYRRYVVDAHANKSKYLIFENTDRPRFCRLFDDRIDLVASKRIYLLECAFTNCEFTCDVDRVKDADAFVVYEDSVSFNASYFDLKKLNIFWRTSKKNSQLAAFDKYMFNWTVSNRQDSEVSDCLNGCVFATRDFVNIEESVALKSHKLFYKNEFLRRSNEAVMIVDDTCEHLQRIQLAIELGSHFKSNFRGMCKTSTFEKRTANYKQARDLYDSVLKSNRTDCADESLCAKNLFNEYKFFISSETSNCTDEISSSFWLALESSIIPVVFFPGRNIYEVLAPKNSFIHAEDFDFDMQELAKHLKKVSESYLLYLDYFVWRFYLFTASSRQYTQKRTICELCYKLNTDNSVIYYEKLSKWFENGCTPDVK
jgi:hypothetical protein